MDPEIQKTINAIRNYKKGPSCSVNTMQIKLWMMNMVVAVAKMVGIKAHNFIFDREKWAARRERHRQVWWKYKQKADQTKDPFDNDRADCVGIYMKFQHTPEEVAQAKMVEEAMKAPRLP